MAHIGLLIPAASRTVEYSRSGAFSWCKISSIDSRRSHSKVLLFESLVSPARFKVVLGSARSYIGLSRKLVSLLRLVFCLGDHTSTQNFTTLTLSGSCYQTGGAPSRNRVPMQVNLKFATVI